MRLRLCDTGIGGAPYRDGIMPAWHPGEERVVSESVAEYLLGAFPDHFAKVHQAPAPEAPPADRAIQSPKRRRTRKSKG